MRAARLRAKNLLVVQVVLAILLMVTIVPRVAHAEEDGVASLEALESVEPDVSATDEPAVTESEDLAQVGLDAEEASSQEMAGVEADGEEGEPEALESEDLEPEVPDTEDAEADPTLVAAPDASSEQELVSQSEDQSAQVTIKNVRLYDLDGTVGTLSDDYNCQKRFVIVGSPTCGRTQNMVSQALSLARYDEFADVSFLVLDIDGDWNAFQQEFASMGTDRVRFFSSNGDSYWKWALWASKAVGHELVGTFSLPITVLIDKSNHVQEVFTGPQDAADLCRTYLSSDESNPDDVDPGDPDQFGAFVPVDPHAEDLVSFSVRGSADTRSGRQLLDYVNKARSAVDVADLTWDEELEQTALQRGAELMVENSHARPDGSSCFTAWPDSQKSATGENIASGQINAVVVNQDWTDSPGHYKNMVNDGFTTFAAAHFVSERGEHYWVECFGGGVGSGVTGAPIVGEVQTPIKALKQYTNLKMCVTPGVYNSNLGLYDRSIPALKPGQGQQLALVSGDADLDASDVIWTSSDPSVVSVDETGRAVAVSTGSADVTAAVASYPDLTVTQTITVTDGTYSLSGVWGTCPWEIDDEHTLWVYPGAGAESDANPNLPVSYWVDYASDITSVRFVERDGRKVEAPVVCAYLFSNLPNLVSVDCAGLDTSQTETMHGLFQGCGSLRQVNLSGLDTSSLEVCSSMFRDCSSLESIDLSGWDVSQVSLMFYMFQGCTALTDLNVSGWDTSKVTDMDGMFRYCTSLTSLDLSSWDTSSLNSSNLEQPMFEGCTALAELRVGEGYVVSAENAFPDATAGNGLWWSTARQQWVSKEDILSGLLGTLDIFASHEVPRSELPVSIADVQVSVEGQTFSYTGEPIEPEIVVTYEGAALTAGVDYAVSINGASNVNVGRAEVRLVGMGRFVGSRTCTFTIAPATLGTATVRVSGQPLVYTGSALTPSVTVKMGNRTLVKGTDYTVSYSKNVDAGTTATVTVTGKGNYTGKASTTFAIKAADLSGCTIAPLATMLYTGSALEPAVTVTLNGQELDRANDYEVTYADNVEAGTATVTVTGKGNYTGEASTTFAIKAKQVISASAKTVAMGKKAKLGAKLSTGDGKLTYKSSNTKVAKVSATGVITPVGVGTCKVTVTAAETSGFARATKNVTVKVTKGAQVIAATGKTLKTGKSVSLGAKRTAGNGKLTYKSSNTNVATVNAKGVITAKNIGTAKITITAAATTNWNKATKTVTVKVTAQAGTWKGSGSRWWYQWADGSYPKSQFLTISGKTYYFNASGYCVYGWQKIGGKDYYFESSGAMAKSKWVDGKYWVGADGVWVKSKTR